MSETNHPRLGAWRIAGLALTFIWFFGGGILHFVVTPAFTSVVPPYIPFPREMVYFTGVCEIAGNHDWDTPSNAPFPDRIPVGYEGFWGGFPPPKSEQPIDRTTRLNKARAARKTKADKAA